MFDVSPLFDRRSTGALLVAAALALAAPAPSAQAQQLERIEKHTDWSVFAKTRGAGRYCYAATTPTKTTASRPNISRDKAFLMVAMFPDKKVVNEVSVRVGFPIDPNQKATLKVGSDTFEMFSDGEDAWSESSAVDKRVVEAFRRGATAVVTTISRRGTRVTDEFSLRGFTKAVSRARALCR